MAVREWIDEAEARVLFEGRPGGAAVELLAHSETNRVVSEGLAKRLSVLAMAGAHLGEAWGWVGDLCVDLERRYMGLTHDDNFRRAYERVSVAGAKIESEKRRIPLL